LFHGFDLLLFFSINAFHPKIKASLSLPQNQLTTLGGQPPPLTPAPGSIKFPPIKYQGVSGVQAGEDERKTGAHPVPQPNLLGDTAGPAIKESHATFHCAPNRSRQNATRSK